MAPDLPLRAELLVRAYSRGIFPMANPRTLEIEWYSPDPRGILPLHGFHIPRRLARTLRQPRFELRTNTAFRRVMRECAAQTPRRTSTWIDERLVEAYGALHDRGLAHSVEAWRDGHLVGGVYGVHLGAAFFGESMFCRPEHGGRDASKVCLAALARILVSRGFVLFDTQFWNPHLDQFGCIEIPRDAYLGLLEQALAIHTTWPAAIEPDVLDVRIDARDLPADRNPLPASHATASLARTSARS